MKRNDVPKNVKPMPTAPLVLICEMIRVVTIACSTSTNGSQHNGFDEFNPNKYLPSTTLFYAMCTDY